MLSELTILVIDSTDQLQAATDRIYNRTVFFIDDDGDGMYIKMMHEQNAAVAARQISDSPDEVYLMYALITGQLWWTYILMYMYMCTHTQALESQLQDEDADLTDDESEACWGRAMQDQHGKELYTGKVACLMCYDTLVLPLYKNESRHAYECKNGTVVPHR